MDGPATLELELALGGPARGLLKAIAPGRPAGSRVVLAWHDPEGALAADGLVLEHAREGRRECWRLLRIRPRAGQAWRPGQPATVLAEQASYAALRAAHEALPAEPGPALTHFEGRMQSLPEAGVRLLLGERAAGAAAGRRAVARLMLAGPGAAALAHRLAETHALEIPRQVLAAEALGAPPRRLGPPALPRHGEGEDGPLDAEQGFLHAAGHLLDVLLHQLDRIAPPRGRLGEPDPEPVHQARVALRRLRSLIALFRPVLGCLALDEADAALKALAKLLGPARDWDVFLAETAPALAAAIGAEPAVDRVLAAARRERAAGYAALAAWRQDGGPAALGLQLALLLLARPWRQAAAPDGAPWQEGLRDFAAAALRRRARRLRRVEDDLAALPLAELHRLRLRAKRMRYVAEAFAPLFPGHGARRTIRRLATLQDALGHLNDGAVAGTLMAALGPAGRGLGGGLVRGFVAGRQAAALAPAQRAWEKLRELEPFWR